MPDLLEQSAPVEVEVSRHCEHGCFTISLGSPGVWRFAGMGPIECEPNDYFVIHRGDLDDCCACWPEDDDA